MTPVPLRSGGLKENAAARCRGHLAPSSRPVRSAGAAWARRPEQHTARLPGAVPEPPASGAARSRAFPASVCLAGTRCGEPAMPERASLFPPQQLRNDRRAPRPPRHRRKGRLRTSCPQPRASAPVSERAFGSAPDCRGGCGVASPARVPRTRRQPRGVRGAVRQPVRGGPPSLRGALMLRARGFPQGRAGVSTEPNPWVPFGSRVRPGAKRWISSVENLGLGKAGDSGKMLRSGLLTQKQNKQIAKPQTYGQLNRACKNG